MGYADADVRHAASSTGDHEEGFRASFIRKRHSLFGRPESISNFDIIAPQSAAPPKPPVQAVPYHDVPPTATNKGPESKRRSFFGGRFKFGGSKKDSLPPPAVSAPASRRDPSPPKSALTAQAQYQRGASSTTDLSDRSQLGENDHTNSVLTSQGLAEGVTIYRNSMRQSISSPFNFQHVTHTHKKHLPALETVDEKDLTKEFWAASLNQVPRAQLMGIQAENISTKLETMGLTRGAANAQADVLSAPSTMQDNVASRSREDITALPGLAGKPKRSASRSKREELSSLLGFRERSNSSTSEQGQARRDTYNALHGIKEDPSTPVSPVSSTKDDLGSLLGFSALSTKQSADSYRSAGDRSVTSETKRSSKLKSQAGDAFGPRRDIGSSLGMWEHSLGDPEETSAKPKKEPTPAKPKKDSAQAKEERRLKRESKAAADRAKYDELDALLGLPKRKPKEPKVFEPMAPPAPPRPRRSDEDLRQDGSLAATPTGVNPPDRPRRDSKDVQHLREMGLGQLLYRENSNESQRAAPRPRDHSADSRYSRVAHRLSATDLRTASSAMHRQTSSDGAYAQPMIRQGSNESRHSQVMASPVPSASSMQQHDSYRTSVYDDDYTYPPTEPLPRIPQTAYRPRQALQPVPRPSNISPEGRSPLQTVSEIGEAYSPLRTPTDSALQPRSPDSARSAHRTIRSPELTGPSMPDDGTWENEIDYIYSKEAEADHEFDWEDSMTPHRLSMKDAEKRLSLNVPQTGMARLSKKLSEGSLRSSVYMPSALNIQPHASRTYRQESPKLPAQEDYATAGARASPEVRVYDVDDQRQDSAYPAGGLHMHGYESIAQGYLSDPESNSERSQHRKSNSYSSWESRPANPREHARYSNASINNVPELTYTRQRKQPITHISTQQQESSTNPMNEYAAFARGPYDSPQTPDFPHRRPENVGQAAMLRATANRARDQQSGWARPAQQQQQQQSGWI